MQMLWDRLEPAGYLSHISDEPLPNTPRHRVLIHYGLGDAQVGRACFFLPLRFTFDVG